MFFDKNKVQTEFVPKKNAVSKSEQVVCGSPYEESCSPGDEKKGDEKKQTDEKIS